MWGWQAEKKAIFEVYLEIFYNLFRSQEGLLLCVISLPFLAKQITLKPFSQFWYSA